MYSEADREKMAAIVNEGLSQVPEAAGITAKNDDFSADDSKNVIYWESEKNDAMGRDKIKKVLLSLITSRRSDTGQFYHFKSIEIARQMLQSREIQLTGLGYLDENDRAEFSEFFKRCGFFASLVDNSVEEFKKKIFVFCLTKDSRSQRFWDEYAQGDAGVCLAIRIAKFEASYAPYWQFRDVIYDDGYRFEFINDIQYKIRKAFGKELFMQGTWMFARHYKRDKYSWENEARISLDYVNGEYSGVLSSMCAPEATRGATGGVQREFVRLPFKNRLFEIVVDEVICGKDVTNADMNRLDAICKPQNIRVWRRV